MTELRLYLTKKSVNKADVSRKTGISPSRLSQLSKNDRTKLSVEELYLIALAIDVKPNEIIENICINLKLKTQ